MKKIWTHFWLIFIVIFAMLSTGNMKTTFAQRLKSIRLRRGWSLEELSNRLGNKVSKQAINKYEQAKMLPDDEVLEALLSVFEIDREYLFRPIIVSLNDVTFRSNHHLGKKEAVALKADVINFIEPYLELENLLGINSQFINPIKLKDACTPDEIEEVVLELRKAWNLGLQPIHNIVELLENEHIKIFEGNSAKMVLGALLAKVNNEIPVIVLQNSLSNLQKRIMVLRELSVLIMPHSAENLEMCNYFAAAFLMPKSVFFEEIGQRRKSISVQELIKN